MTELVAALSARVGTRSLELELRVAAGPLVLVGPNGAGKTSVLRLLLGARRVDRGRIEVGGAVLLDTERHIDVPVEARGLAYVPQDYALFPNMTVRENVAFAVHASTGARDPAKLDAALDRFGLGAVASRFPGTLSGGEKQRVALARALATAPRALLLDEPLAALDVHARRDVRRALAEELRRLAIPSIVVTHDAADARELGDTIAVLESGRVTQVGRWGDLASAPGSPFVEALTRA